MPCFLLISYQSTSHIVAETSPYFLYFFYMILVKIIDGGLYFIFSFYFILFFFSCFLFNFQFLEQLGLGVISHTVTSVTNWWHSHKTDYRENEVEGSGTKWRHIAWTTHVGLMLYSWSFRVGCTVASTDHG